MRVIPLLLATLLVGACASPAQQSGSSAVNERPDANEPVFRQAPVGVVRLRERLRRSDPRLDGYAQRYPARFDAGVWQIYNQLNHLSRRLKARQQRKALNLPKAYRQVLGASWLIRDLRAATGRAVLQMSDADTQALMNNLLDGLKQTAKTTPRECARISVGVPGLVRGLPKVNRNIYRQQVRAAIVSRQRRPRQLISAERLKQTMVQTNRIVGKRYPDRLNWSTDDNGLSDDRLRRRCELRIANLIHIGDLPMPERLGMQRVLLSSLAEQASLASWKTYLSHNERTKTLVISGPMAADLPSRLIQLLRKHPDTRRIVLDSPGGLQHIGLRLADIIRRHNLDTHVTHICLSACTMAYLGGNQRTIGSNATLGYHDSIQSGVSTKALTTNLDAYRRYYPGMPDMFLSKIRETPNTAMWAPSETELLQAKVITALGQPASPINVQTVLTSDRRPATAALLADLRENAVFWSMQSRRLSGLELSGTKNQTIANYIWDDHRANMRAYRVNMPDELIDQALSLRVRILGALEKKPGTCLRTFAGEPIRSALKSSARDLYAERQALHVKLINAGGPLKVTRWDPRQAKDATRELVAFLLKRKDINKSARKWIIQNLGNPIEPVSDERACYALKTILRKIAAAKPAQRGPLFRAMQRSMLRWVGKDRYGQPLPWADRVAFDSTR